MREGWWIICRLSGLGLDECIYGAVGLSMSRGSLNFNPAMTYATATFAISFPVAYEIYPLT